MILIKIISGGQTGADRAALDVAIWHQFPHGGWCPKGRKAEDGPLAGKYELQETPKADYKQRTEWNVRDSDGTIVFTRSAEATGGSLKTIRLAGKHQKPCLHLTPGYYDAAVKIQSFIREHQISVLNIAGSLESKEPGIYAWVKQILDDALFYERSHPNMLGGPGEG